MLEELQKIIKENLPQQVGEELRKRLEQADEDKANLKTKKESNKILQERLDTTISLNLKSSEKINELTKELDSFKEREQDILDKEKYFYQERAYLEIQMLRERMEFGERMLDKVFGHPSVTIERQNKIENIDRGRTDSNGQWVVDAIEKNGEQETVTKTESKE